MPFSRYRRSFYPSSLGLLVFLLLAPQLSLGADKAWNGGTTTWNTNTNWTPSGAPGNTDNAVFNSTFSNQPNLTGSATVGGIWMTGSIGQNVTISGSTLTLNGNTINGTAGLGILVDNAPAFALTITAPITLGNAQTWRNNSGNLLTIGAGGINLNNKALTIDGTGNTLINGILSNGNAAITKAGGGTLTLTGTNTNTGTMIVSAGVLNIQNSSALGTTAAGTSVSSGAALQIQNSIAVGAEALTLNGTGISNDGALRNISGTNSYAGVITLGSATRINSDAGTLTLDVASGSAITGTQNLTFGGAGNVTVNDAIATSTGTLTKDGAGTLTLSAANTYTGLTTVTAGTLREGVSNAISTGALTVNGATAVFDLGASHSDTVGTVTVDGGGSITGTGTSTLTTTGTFEMKSGSASAILAGAVALNKTTSGTVTLSGANTYTGVTTISAGTLSVGTIGNGGTAGNLGAATNVASNLVFDGGTLQYTGATASTDRNFTINAGQTATFDITTNTLTLSGTSTATSGALTKIGAGTLILSGANAYTGLTTITAGTLAEGVSNAISTGGVTVNGATAVFDLGASHSDTVGTVTVDGGGSITGTGTSTLTSTGSFEMKNGSASAILDGSGIALNKTTSGTVTLTGANTYTGGTNVSGGALLANNASGSATGTGSVTVTGAGTLLGGNGTITGAVSMASGTILSPGATTTSGSTAILNTGALTLNSGSNFTVDLNGTTAGTGYDQVQVTGAVNISGSNLVVNPAAGLTVGNKFFILLNDASDPISGTFSQGATIIVGSDTFAINYLDNGNGGGNDISLTLISVIPEPATWVGAVLALGVLGWSQRPRLSRNRKAETRPGA